MVDLERLRSHIAALPEVAEGTHFRLPAYKVRDKVFVLVEKGEGTLLLSVDPDAASAAVAADPDTYEEVWRNDGAIFVGVRAVLVTARDDRLHALVEAAWRNKAPKRLAAQHPRL